MAYLKIIRPVNCLFVIITVCFGAYYKADFSLLPVLFAALAAFFIAAGGYVINDFFDYEIDKINRSERILPSGLISLKAARNYAFFLFLVGIIFSIFTGNRICIFLAIFNSILLYHYSKSFKRMFLVGNLVVAYNAASTFIFGGLSNDNIRNGIIISLFGFLYTLVRELVKDIQDLDGDERLGAETLAVRWGEKRTFQFSLIPAGVIVLLIQVLKYFTLITWESFILLNFLVTLPLAIFFVIMFKGVAKITLGRISGFMKLDMLVLLIILMIGK